MSTNFDELLDQAVSDYKAAFEKAADGWDDDMHNPFSKKYWEDWAQMQAREAGADLGNLSSVVAPFRRPKLSDIDAMRASFQTGVDTSQMPPEVRSPQIGQYADVRGALRSQALREARNRVDDDVWKGDACDSFRAYLSNLDVTAKAHTAIVVVMEQATYALYDLVDMMQSDLLKIIREGVDALKGVPTSSGDAFAVATGIIGLLSPAKKIAYAGSVISAIGALSSAAKPAVEGYEEDDSPYRINQKTSDLISALNETVQTQVTNFGTVLDAIGNSVYNGIAVDNNVVNALPTPPTIVSSTADDEFTFERTAD